MSTKKIVWDFLILFRSWLINKIVKKTDLCECVEITSLLSFGNNSKSKQNKKPRTPFGGHW